MGRDDGFLEALRAHNQELQRINGWLAGRIREAEDRLAAQGSPVDRGTDQGWQAIAVQFGPPADAGGKGGDRESSI